jgi:predicted transcriptional regulator
MRQSETNMGESSSAALIWILKIFSQERYFDMVRVIARDATCTENDLTSNIIMDELNLSRRQFNFRISRLMVGRMVKKNNNRYSLTKFGEEAYNAIRIIESARRIQSRLKAVDMLKFSECSADEDVDKILNMLIHSEHVRELITQTSLHQFIGLERR